MTSSSLTALGTPMTATSRTVGWAQISASTSKRGDVLAAPPDRVLDAVDEVEVAVLVVAERVAGVEPAVAPGRGGRLRHA